MNNMGYQKKLTLVYLAKNLSIILGLVLIWRGVWHVLDSIDIWFFGGSHFLTGLGGIIVGLIILYAPDHDLKEIQKL